MKFFFVLDKMENRKIASQKNGKKEIRKIEKN